MRKDHLDEFSFWNFSYNKLCLKVFENAKRPTIYIYFCKFCFLENLIHSSDV